MALMRCMEGCKLSEDGGERSMAGAELSEDGGERSMADAELSEDGGGTTTAAKRQGQARVKLKQGGGLSGQVTHWQSNLSAQPPQWDMPPC